MREIFHRVEDTISLCRGITAAKFHLFATGELLPKTGELSVDRRLLHFKGNGSAVRAGANNASVFALYEKAVTYPLDMRHVVDSASLYRRLAG